MTVRLLQFLIFLTLILSVISCSFLDRKTGIEQPDDSGYWELVWAEPQIISSDSTHTLIYASRVDSFYVDQKLPHHLPSHFQFQIKPPDCRVAVRMFDIEGNFLTPLYSGSLQSGHYKFSFYPENLKVESVVSNSFIIHFEICGKTTKRLILR